MASLVKLKDQFDIAWGNDQTPIGTASLLARSA
jgi:hypothetical protein